MAQLDEWGADRWERFTPIRVTGAVMFIDTAPGWAGAPAQCYVELFDETPFDGHAPNRIPVFCDIRQLGLTDSVRRAVQRRPRADARRKVGEATGRMLITARDLAVAQQNGRAPRCPFVTVAVQPQIFAPGLPCIVMSAPSASPLHGHNVLVVDSSYRHVETHNPQAERLKTAIASSLKH